MSCGNSRSSKCNPCGPSEAAVNSIADRAAYYARIAVEAANSACFQLQEEGNRRWAYIGDGIQTIFDIPGAGTTISASYIVGIDGVLQDPDNYTVQQTHPSGPYTLTMSVPVPAGSEIVIVSIKGITGATGAPGIQGSAGPFGGLRWAYIGENNTNFSIVGNTTNNPLGYSVNLDGITQDPANYSILGNTLIMSSPVPNGTAIVITSLNGIQGATGPSGGPTGATGPVGPAFPSGGLRWAYTGNGSQTVFNIAGASTTLATAYLVTIDGITQDSANYTITAGSPYTLTISTIPNGSVIVITSLTVGLANWITGFGSPNGVVTAPTGSVYTNLNGGSLSTLYVKESGSGDTGWIAK
jgi:hypothetical protein